MAKYFILRALEFKFGWAYTRNQKLLVLLIWFRWWNYVQLQFLSLNHLAKQTTFNLTQGSKFRQSVNLVSGVYSRTIGIQYIDIHTYIHILPEGEMEYHTKPTSLYLLEYQCSTSDILWLLCPLAVCLCLQVFTIAILELRHDDDDNSTQLDSERRPGKLWQKDFIRTTTQRTPYPPL